MEREIKILPGSNLESVVYTLLEAKARGERVYCFFNGHKLHSDTVSMDLAYKEVTGQSKTEVDQQMKDLSDAYSKGFDQSRKRLQEIAESNIKRGLAIIQPEKYEDWCKYAQVDDRFEHIGDELLIRDALVIMEALYRGVTIDEARKTFIERGYSPEGASLIRNTIRIFSSNGQEFWKATVDDIKKIAERHGYTADKMAQIDKKNGFVPYDEIDEEVRKHF